MQHAAASAYAKTARTTQSPRELEAHLLIKAAHRLQLISDDWTAGAADLPAALTYNRKIWTVISTSATEPDNPLPPALKQNIAQLAAAIFQRTMAVLADPEPGKLAMLVRINRDIAAGLRMTPRPA